MSFISSGSTRSLRPLFGLLALLVVAQPAVFAQDAPADGNERSHGVRRFVERGTPTTGLNRALGEPVWHYPALEPMVPIFGPLITTIGFRTVGAFDAGLGAGAGNAPALDPSMSGDTVLASHLDARGLGFVGLDPSSVPPEHLNIPIHQTKILVDEHGVQRADVPCASETSDLSLITRAAPCDQPLTVNDWMAARGNAFFRCFPNGNARVTLSMWRLVPNRLFSVWAIVEDFASGPQFLIRPVPFGGVPNLVVSDRFGRASTTRDLSYCPHDEPSFLGVAVVMRSSGENFGGVPAPYLNQQDPFNAFEGFAGLIPGTVAHVQLSFNVGGVPVEEPDD